MTDQGRVKVFINVNQSLQKQIEILSTDNVAGIKRKLLDSLGDSSLGKVNLVFAGKVLEDEQLVQDLYLSNQSTIHAITESRATGTPVSPAGAEQQSQTAAVSPYQYYVYCKSCDSVEPGKLRVRCKSCQDSGIVLNKGPNKWDDVLLQDRLTGHCLSCAKEGIAQFYFKCASHEGSETAVPLRHVRSNRKHRECITCTLENPVVLVYPCEARHVICLDCFKSYCSVSLENRKFVHHPEIGYSLPCPAGCDNSLIGDNHHFCILGKEKYEQYKDFGAEDYLLNTGGIICPNRGCGEGMVLDQNPGRNVQCASCQFVFCMLCMSGRHNDDCTIRSTVNPRGELTDMDTGRLQRSRWDSESLETIQVTTKPCPHCKTRTEKAGGCMHMQCTRCKFEWCWICEKVWDRDCQGNHWFG